MVIIGGLRFPCVVQWVRLCVSNAGGVGSIPGQGTKIPHVCLTVGDSPGSSPVSLTFFLACLNFLPARFFKL